MGENEVNWWSGKGPTNPKSNVPLANQYDLPKSDIKKGAGGNFADGFDFVVEHPEFEVIFSSKDELPKREELYATFKGDLSWPNEKGEKERVYMVWENGSDDPIIATTRPSRYTDEIRDIS